MEFLLKQGFTLIELSIVLVVIGLLVGGVRASMPSITLSPMRINRTKGSNRRGKED